MFHFWWVGLGRGFIIGGLLQYSGNTSSPGCCGGPLVMELRFNFTH